MQWRQCLQEVLSAPFRSSLYRRLWMGITLGIPVAITAFQGHPKISLIYQALKGLLFGLTSGFPRFQFNSESLQGWVGAGVVVLCVYRCLMQRFCQAHSLRREQPSRSLQNVWVGIAVYQVSCWLLTRLLDLLDLYLGPIAFHGTSAIGATLFAHQFLRQSAFYLPVYLGLQWMFKAWANLDKDSFSALFAPPLVSKNSQRGWIQAGFLFLATLTATLQNGFIPIGLQNFLQGHAGLAQALEALPYLGVVAAALSASQQTQVYPKRNVPSTPVEELQPISVTTEVNSAL